MNAGGVTDMNNSLYTPKSSGEMGNSDMGMDAFLKLFITQLQTQNPLEPLDETEQLAQLAQFTSVEQQMKSNEMLEKMAALMLGQGMSNAVGYIGKEVWAAGGALVVGNGESTNSKYTVPANAAKVSVDIYDEEGNIVQSVDLGAKEAGEYTFAWDGMGSDGLPVADGQYSVQFRAETSTGANLQISNMVQGMVTGVSLANGSVVLELSDGRKVLADNVWEISTPSPKPDPEPEPDPDPDPDPDPAPEAGTRFSMK